MKKEEGGGPVLCGNQSSASSFRTRQPLRDSGNTNWVLPEEVLSHLSIESAKNFLQHYIHLFVICNISLSLRVIRK